MSLVAKWILLCLLSHLLSWTSASVRLELQMIRFENAPGKGSNGNCCDGMFGLCRSDCDQYFHICLDRGNGDDSITSCPLGELVTDYVHNKDSFDFESLIGSTPNPIIFNLNAWLSNGIKLKIKVWDHDSSNSHDHVDDLSAVVQGSPDSSRSTAQARSFVLQERTTLTLWLKAYCNANWYGSLCDRMCVPKNDGSGHYTCDASGNKVCRNGWGGSHCLTDIDECASAPCLHDATCVDGLRQYRCNCVWPYHGSNCELNQDPCLSSPCQNRGTCSSSASSGFLCRCPPGYAGTRCQTDVNECASSPCQHGATCVDGEATYTCECPPAYTGGQCERHKCAFYPCMNGGRCVIVRGSTVCRCPSGYSGSRCDTDVDECASSPCQHGATCVDGEDTYSCECPQAYTGAQCQQHKCADYPCVNGGRCDVANGTAMCVCSDGFSGTLCETETDECSSNPCLHGGTCTDQVDNYECTCPAIYTGKRCETNVDNCANTTCLNGGHCVQGPGAVSMCVCPVGFTGMSCGTPNQPDPCGVSPCLNNGTCTSSPRADTAYVCQCPDSFTGVDCGTESLLDPCYDDPCGPYGTCQRSFDDYSCVCNDKWTGKSCDSPLTFCETNPCRNDGKCTETESGYSCQCPDNWVGVRCDSVLCTNATCLNEGVCRVEHNTTLCECLPGFTGSTCETGPGPCYGQPCTNGGTCVGDTDVYRCVCALGFHGPQCETETHGYLPDPDSPSSMMFLGTFNQTEVDDLKGSLLDIVAEQRHIAVDKLELIFKPTVCTGSTGETVTIFEFQILDETGKVVPWYRIAELLRKTTGHLDKLLHTHQLYNGSECVSSANEAFKTGASKDVSPTFWAPWKLTVCGVVIVICFGFVIGGVVISQRRKRQQWTVESSGVTNPLFETRNSTCSYIGQEDAIDSQTGVTSLGTPLPPIPRSEC